MEKYIELPFTMNIVGSCGAGKSYMIRYFCSSFQNHFKHIMVISNTALMTDKHDYSFLKNGFNHSISGTINADEKILKLMSIQEKKTNKPPVLLILDDVYGDIKNSKILKRLCTTFRHYNISIIFSVQYVYGHSTELREISRYACVFNQKSRKALEAIYQCYFMSEYDTFNEFKRNFQLHPFHFYFIDRVNNTTKIMVCP